MNILEIANLFLKDNHTETVQKLGNGHINDTYLITSKSRRRYVLQQMNRRIFPEPQKVMENISLVTEYVQTKLHSEGGMKTLCFLNYDGKKYYTDPDGGIWRMYHYIEDAVSLELISRDEDFYWSAVAFGGFQYMLRDFPAEKLYETLPDFHNTPKRFKDFLNSVKADRKDRAKTCQQEIQFVKSRESFYNILEESHKAGELPLRVTHNDTKLNNVLLNADTGRPLCIIDLDTIMPGYSVTDFGDSIRFGASTAKEDEKDLDKVHFSLQLYKVYLKGFMDGAKGIFSKQEMTLFPVGAKMMTMECGMRFLADYLDGDVYFKTQYPEHNLVRARTQFKLVEEMEENWDQMEKAIADIL